MNGGSRFSTVVAQYFCSSSSWGHQNGSKVNLIQRFNKGTDQTTLTRTSESIENENFNFGNVPKKVSHVLNR